MLERTFFWKALHGNTACFTTAQCHRPVRHIRVAGFASMGLTGNTEQVANTQWVRPPGREMNPLIDMAQRVKEGLKNRRVQVELSHFGPLVLMVGLGLALALYTSGRELRHPQTFPSKKRRTCQLAEIDDPPEYERLGHRFYETSKLRKFGEEPFITRPSLRAFFMLPPVLPGDDKPALGGPPAHHRLSA